MRPVEDHERPIDVLLRAVLMSFGSISEKDQTMTLSLGLEVEYENANLQWNKSDYDNITQTYFGRQEVFVPNIYVLNNKAILIKHFGNNNHYLNVNAGGSVFYELGDQIITSCNIDITYYPFDTQMCYIDFITDDADRLFMGIWNNTNTGLNMQFLSEDGSWVIVGHRSYTLHDLLLTSHQKVRYSLLLQRRTTFHLLTIIGVSTTISIFHYSSCVWTPT